MLREIRPAILILLLLTAITGVAYPLAMTAIAGVIFPKQAQGLTYRSWWDAADGGASDGPIASAWHVLGRPAIYMIDGAGVIQFVDLRYEDLLKGVRQMLTDHMNQLDRAGVGHK
jgi:hypothetical protein